jgi:hypothetical protein
MGHWWYMGLGPSSPKLSRPLRSVYRQFHYRAKHFLGKAEPEDRGHVEPFLLGHMVNTTEVCVGAESYGCKGHI